MPNLAKNWHVASFHGPSKMVWGNFSYFYFLPHFWIPKSKKMPFFGQKLAKSSKNATFFKQKKSICMKIGKKLLLIKTKKTFGADFSFFHFLAFLGVKKSKNGRFWLKIEILANFKAQKIPKNEKFKNLLRRFCR